MCNMQVVIINPLDLLSAITILVPSRFITSIMDERVKARDKWIGQLRTKYVIPSPYPFNNLQLFWERETLDRKNTDTLSSYLRLEIVGFPNKITKNNYCVRVPITSFYRGEGNGSHQRLQKIEILWDDLHFPFLHGLKRKKIFFNVIFLIILKCCLQRLVRGRGASLTYPPEGRGIFDLPTRDNILADNIDVHLT